MHKRDLFIHACIHANVSRVRKCGYLNLTARKTILIVDDDPTNRALLSDILDDSYDIVEAVNGKEAISALQKYGIGIQLVLLDIQMPEMDGYEVLDIMKKQGWIDNIPVIMVSSTNEADAVPRTLAYGVADYIGRPFNVPIIRRRVNNTLMLYAREQELAGMIEDQIHEREDAVNLMISILSHIVEFRNGESGLHVQHVNAITECLLRHIAEKSDAYNISQSDITLITMASSLHDIGKISIPEEVLNKPGKLTDEEFELMKTHSLIGAQMLNDLPGSPDEPLVRSAYEICRWHHERYDGRGYPDGLKGDEIPISAQVVSVADVYDALTSERVYKPAFSHEKALDMIMNGECGAFNPFLLKCLNEAADEIRETLTKTSLSGSASGQAKKIVDTAFGSKELAPSSRTLDLIDYERVKHQFFAMMSNEVQFEFTADPPLIVISDWGNSKLGLDEVIQDPFNDEVLIDMFGKENLDKLEQKLLSTTVDDPIFQCDFQANIQGDPHWYHLACRALWNETDKGMEYRGFIGKMVDIQENRERMTDLERKATQDSMTGLINHAYARKVINEAIREYPDDTFVIMIIDMDNFKNVNDTYGHLFGDEVLKELARRLRASVRDNDVVSRLGGDEFMICMHLDVDPQPLIGRIYNALLGVYEGCDISVSMGVVCARGRDADYETLFRCADHALYDMKRAGRGGYVYAKNEEENDADYPTTISQIDVGEER